VFFFLFSFSAESGLTKHEVAAAFSLSHPFHKSSKEQQRIKSTPKTQKKDQQMHHHNRYPPKMCLELFFTLGNLCLHEQKCTKVCLELYLL
jgi:hypothetical protein